jgi:hypothetical protein
MKALQLMSLLDDFDVATSEFSGTRDVDSCLDSLQNGDTNRLLDDLLGRHDDDDFPASSVSELAALED